MTEYLAEADVKKFGHHFWVGVESETGQVKFAVDGGEKAAAKALLDGRVIFYAEREIVVKDSIQLVKSIDLTAADFLLLKSAQERILADRAAAASEAKKAAGDYRRQISRWKQKVKKRKLADKSFEKYCIHDISIGADRYSFLEHIVPGAEDAVVINPNYRIEPEVPGAGGRVSRYGEMIVWEYWQEETGWYIVRELSFNEKICVALIYDYGYFSRGKTKKKRRMSIRRIQKEAKKGGMEKHGKGREGDGKKGLYLFKVRKSDS